MQKNYDEFLQSDELNGKKVGLRTYVQCDVSLSSRRKKSSTRLESQKMASSRLNVDVKLWYCWELV